MTDINAMARRLREHFATGEIVVAPGVYDQVGVMLAVEAGHHAVFASGFWAAAAAYGEPDVGIAGASDFLAVFGRMAAKSPVPVIADADTGFGSLANLDRAVKAYARAGIAAMQLEDQPFPKVCGHVGTTKAVAKEEMCARLHAAVDARGDDQMMLIGRCDALRAEGFEAAIDRLLAYSQAGADILFLEAPGSLEQIEQAAKTLDKPLMIGAAHGGVTPIASPSEYAALGVGLVVYPAGAPLAAAYSAQKFYRDLAADEANVAMEGMLGLKDMGQMIGMGEIAALQEKHGFA